MDSNRIITIAIALSIFIAIYICINGYINGIIKDKSERKKYKKKETLINKILLMVAPIIAYPNLIELINKTNFESLQGFELAIFILKILTFIIFIVFSFIVMYYQIRLLKSLKKLYDI